MLILAIDTSTEEASVALMLDGRVTAEFSWNTAGNHSRHLSPVIQHVLTVGASSPSDLTHLIVASGPGSFNGLRVGISEAKGMAFGLQIPLTSASTLDVIALQASTLGTSVCASIPAGRGEVYVARYAGTGHAWERISDYGRVSLADLVSNAGEGDLLAGPGAPLIAGEYERKGTEARFVNGPDTLRRGGYLAELGRRYFDANGADQLDIIQPLYLRPSAAEENRARASRG